MIRQLDVDKKILTLNINWAAILSFIVFWCYGYCSAAIFRTASMRGNIIISVILFVILLLFIWLWRFRPPEYKDAITITKKDIIVFLSYFAIMVVFSIFDLMEPLQSDQLYHSDNSQVHAQIIIHSLSYFTDMLDNYFFSSILYAFNLITIGILVILFLVFRKKSFIVKLIIFLGAFILLRSIIFIKFGGNTDPHPPFRYFPLWLSSSIISAGNFSFRLPQFLGLVCLMWMTQKVVDDKSDFLKSWLFGLSIGTIPLLWHIGTLVEQSIWTAIIWTMLLLAISKDKNLNDFNWFRWVTLVSIFTLMRQSAFVALIPLFLLFFINNYRNIGIRRLLLLSAPILSMLPFLLKSIIEGTPATWIAGPYKGNYNYIPADASSIQRVYLAFTTGIAPKIILNSIMLPWILFLPFAFIPLQFNFKKLTKHIVVLIFFVSACFIFYSIDPRLWGIGRYQAEYVIPFVILGFLNILTKMNSNLNKITSTILVVSMASLLCYNFVFKSLLYTLNKPNILSQTLYSYDDALKTAKQEGYAGHTLIIGGTYGCLPEILNGFTVSEMRSQFEIRKQANKTGFGKVIDYQALKDNQNIKLVLISDVDQGLAISNMLSLVWKHWKTFQHDKSGAIIYGMIRDNQ